MPRSKRRMNYKLLSMLLVLALVFESIFLFSRDFLNNGQGTSAFQTSPTTIASGTNTGGKILSTTFSEPQLTLGTKWGNVAKKLVGYGALNVSFLRQNVRLTAEQAGILNGTGNTSVELGPSSAMFDLYVLWALGINNKNEIISNGSMMHFGGDPYNLASTGGYGPVGALSLSNLSILNLTPAEQAIAKSVASDVYRPCCDNPAAFPDCNHGAAQLGLIELMASQGSNATQIYAAMKGFNSLYFAQQYAEIAEYFNSTKGLTWSQIPANVVVGYNYSSYSGFAKIHQYLQNKNLLPSVSSGGGSSCGA